jgi:rhodanese-related sulfurtransferase
MLTITPKELTELIDKSPEKIELIDVRGTDEYSESHIPEARNIPLHLLPMRISEVDTKKQVIFICRSGGRSGQACSFTANSSINAYNLVGGMIDYAKEFPNRVVYGEKEVFGLF